MISEAISRFTAVKPREHGGSIGSNRFAFQLSWAFTKILELQRSGEDYAIVLDYHDDIVIVREGDTGRHLEFFQIKTKSRGNWTLENLLKRESDSTLSIIGKMHTHLQNFEEFVLGMNFVSNAHYSVQLKKSTVVQSLGNKDNVGAKTKRKNEEKLSKSILPSFRISDLDESGIRNLNVSIQQEHNLTYSPLGDWGVNFRNTVLSVNDHENHAKGCLASFLDDVHGLSHLSTAHVFRCLIDDLRWRSNWESTCDTSEILLEKKALTKIQMDLRIEQIRRSSRSSDWETFENALFRENINFKRVLGIKEEWNKYQIDMLNPQASLIHDAKIRIMNSFDQQQAAELESISSMIDHVVSICLPYFTTNSIPISSNQIAAIFLTHYHELGS